MALSKNDGVGETDVPSRNDELNSILKFLQDLKVCLGTPKTMCRWTKATEDCKTTMENLTRSLSQMSFSGKLAKTSATDMLVISKREEFITSLLEVLRGANADLEFPKEVSDNAAKLLDNLLVEIRGSEGKFQGNVASEVLPLISKLQDLLIPSSPERAEWTLTHRLLSTALALRTSYDAYSAMGGTPEARAKADAKQLKLEDLWSVCKAMSGQIRGAPAIRCNDHGLDALKDLITAIVQSDGPAHYDSERAKVDRILDEPVDPEDSNANSIAVSFGGTRDGTDWHNLLADDMCFKDLQTAANKSILTLSPKLFKSENFRR